MISSHMFLGLPRLFVPSIAHRNNSLEHLLITSLVFYWASQQLIGASAHHELGLLLGIATTHWSICSSRAWSSIGHRNNSLEHLLITSLVFYWASQQLIGASAHHELGLLLGIATTHWSICSSRAWSSIGHRNNSLEHLLITTSVFYVLIYMS